MRNCARSSWLQQPEIVYSRRFADPCSFSRSNVKLRPNFAQVGSAAEQTRDIGLAFDLSGCRIPYCGSSFEIRVVGQVATKRRSVPKFLVFTPPLAEGTAWEKLR